MTPKVDHGKTTRRRPAAAAMGAFMRQSTRSPKRVMKLLGCGRRTEKSRGFSLIRPICRGKARALTNIPPTVVWRSPRPGSRETVPHRRTVLSTSLKTVGQAAPALRHVHLSQGTRWYRKSHGSLQEPARRTIADMPPQFLYTTSRISRGIPEKKAMDLASVGRPHAVCGFSREELMNRTLAIDVYAKTEGVGLLSAFRQAGAYAAL